MNICQKKLESVYGPLNDMSIVGRTLLWFRINEIKICSPCLLQATEDRKKNAISKGSVYPPKFYFQSIRNTLVEDIIEILVFNMLSGCNKVECAC